MARKNQGYDLAVGGEKNRCTRDFEISDEKGNTIITASSQWALIDVARKRPVLLHDHLPDYQVINERALDSEFPKIPSTERCDIQKSFSVRYDDIDVNGHVNNSIYPLWATESVETQFRMTHQPAEIEIAFKKECLYGETVAVFTQIEGQKTLHSIVSKQDERELSRLRILWK